MYDINYQADMLNPSDLLKRLEYLQTTLENEDELLYAEELIELDELRAHEDTLIQLAENGTVLINADYFEEYIKNNLQESGVLNGVPNFLVIDWESTANDMLGDFSEIDLNGEGFYY